MCVCVFCVRREARARACGVEEGWSLADSNHTGWIGYMHTVHVCVRRNVEGLESQGELAACSGLGVNAKKGLLNESRVYRTYPGRGGGGLADTPLACVDASVR